MGEVFPPPLLQPWKSIPTSMTPTRGSSEGPARPDVTCRVE